MSERSKYLKLGLGVLISIACLWFAVRNVPFTELRHSVAGARYIWLLPAIVLLLLSILARAKRWVVLLDIRGHFTDSFWAQGIGYLFTNVLPLRMGEPARVIVMAERCKLPVLQVVASAIVERLLDVGTIVIAFIFVLPWMQVPAFVIRAGMLFGVMTLLTFMLLVVGVRFNHRSESLLRCVFGRIPILPVEGIIARWRELVNGLALSTRWQIVVQAVGWSLVSWALSVGMFWAVLYSFKADSTFVEATFMVVTLSLAMSVPSTPGFIGVFQLVGQQALVLPFGAKYDMATALAITLLIHLVYYLITTVLGIIGLWKLGDSFMNLGRAITVWQAARGKKSDEITS